MTTDQKRFERNSVFRCPEGIEEDVTSPTSVNGGDYPTHAGNNAFQLFFDSQSATNGMGVPSWYQLNCRNESDPSNTWPDGSGITPFMGWQSGSGNPANFGKLKDGKFQRKLSYVKKAADTVMIVEAASQNWHDQTENTQYNIFLKRLGARHGKKRGPDGIFADLNMAFFDGHVALYPVEPFERPRDAIRKFKDGTIFCLGNPR
jgi:prepilin-type processing-associated H-X9-DG protein